MMTDAERILKEREGWRKGLEIIANWGMTVREASQTLSEAFESPRAAMRDSLTKRISEYNAYADRLVADVLDVKPRPWWRRLWRG